MLRTFQMPLVHVHVPVASIYTSSSCCPYIWLAVAHALFPFLTKPSHNILFRPGYVWFVLAEFLCPTSQLFSNKGGTSTLH